MIKSADLTGHGLSSPPPWPTPAELARFRAQLRELGRVFARFSYAFTPQHVRDARPRPLAIDGHAYRRRTRGRRR